MNIVDLKAPIELTDREVIRKRLAALRAEGMVPAVIHNHGQESLHVMGRQAGLEKVWAAAGKHHPLQLKTGKQEFLALIKDAHFHPVKRRLDHLVFQAIRRDEKVEAEVPIHIEGEIPAEKIGLEILHQLDHVEVEALPKNLPDALKVDASKLAEVGDKITVSDLQVPDGVTVLTDAEHPIATIVEPKEQVVEIEEPEVEEVEGEEVTAEGEESAPTEGEEVKTAESSESKEQKS